MYKVTHSDKVKCDRRQITNWYDNINPKLADQFEDEYLTVEQIIAKHPKIAPIIDNKSTRKLTLKQYPYYIFYTINETKNTIQILTIRHHKQDELRIEN